MIAAESDLNLEVFNRYAGISLPRHVAYPMPTWWSDVDADDVEGMRTDARSPDRDVDMSLYLHIPYCESLCKFCACNRVIMRHDASGAENKVDRYVTAIERELEQLSKSVRSDRRVKQIHWGGGSPTYLSGSRIAQIQRKICEWFEVDAQAEVAIEVDPRTCSPEKLGELRKAGFTRISLGVQDFSEKVQEHVRRIQSFELVSATVKACRELEFDSVNFDLIYGLPYQTVETVGDTIKKTIELEPDRIAYYHYAQIPEKIATQRGMDYTKLPNSLTKLDMFLLGTRLFGEAGYEFVGLDHFAKPGEMLSRASEDDTLQRNFQGMTTGGGLDLYGVGVSSISHYLGVGFLQNAKDVDAYVDRIEQGLLAVCRGKALTKDDLVRQALLNDLYCGIEVDPGKLEKKFGINFGEYFKTELETLRELEQDGLVVISASGGFRATSPLGRVLLRNVAAVFDAYLEDDAYRVGDQNCFSANA